MTKNWLKLNIKVKKSYYFKDNIKQNINLIKDWYISKQN